MKSETLAAVLKVRAEKRAAVLLTNLQSGKERLVEASQLASLQATESELAEEIAAALRSDKSRTIETDDGPVFLNVYNPALRMIIVGAVHIAQPLARMAELAGYGVTVVDPRRSFASEERFPGVELSSEWPDDALADFGLDARTAVVTLTHDPKLDDPALEVALKSDAFYIGSLGSNRTHASRLERLTEMGFDQKSTDRIHGPVGLNIGAKSPAEIAVSILGQVTETLRTSG
ncbi:MAG: XdhC family protein [Alphaproteobacteria bacterium]|jgi:xanthine dehydrogenase accessory factor|nr:XdhC family protein [Alphaproteobacteria bacterium]MBT4017472.1 XdhC family protein [Alphaproteobacteria bacterium]MBT4967012.1 XdhC family protein [Alphaproteobacteria bacterium]MBT5158339.1 XdhC family protein [Alphaproteobacteria bacterium]MBT5919468.1 XdhC family protein [Alphaproteobacteria bacterium]